MNNIEYIQDVRETFDKVAAVRERIEHALGIRRDLEPHAALENGTSYETNTSRACQYRNNQLMQLKKKHVRLLQRLDLANGALQTQHHALVLPLGLV